jgi:hypothetical protein
VVVGRFPRRAWYFCSPINNTIVPAIAGLRGAVIRQPPSLPWDGDGSYLRCVAVGRLHLGAWYFMRSVHVGWSGPNPCGVGRPQMAAVDKSMFGAARYNFPPPEAARYTIPSLGQLATPFHPRGRPGFLFRTRRGWWKFGPRGQVLTQFGTRERLGKLFRRRGRRGTLINPRGQRGTIPPRGRRGTLVRPRSGPEICSNPGGTGYS